MKRSREKNAVRSPLQPLTQAVGGAGAGRGSPRQSLAGAAPAPHLRLTDVLGLVAANGYAREANACAGVCRETWRCIPAGLDAASAARCRRYELALWPRIVNLPHGKSALTRLHFAAAQNARARVEDLVQWGAELGARTARGSTALSVAVDSAAGGAARALLAAGAAVDVCNGSGMTPLMVASWHGAEGGRLAAALLRAGAKPGARAAHDGAFRDFTALHFCAANGGARQLDVAGVLLRGGADVDAATAGAGTSPLMMAAGRGNVPLVRQLLAAGANARAATADGLTARTVASDGGTPGARAAICVLLDAAAAVA